MKMIVIDKSSGKVIFDSARTHGTIVLAHVPDNKKYDTRLFQIILTNDMNQQVSTEISACDLVCLRNFLNIFVDDRNVDNRDR